MSIDQVAAVARAVLYEGYLLYPYRPSAIKNRQRWTFGGVYPRAYTGAQSGVEPWQMQTQILLEGGEGSRLSVSIGFLHLTEREVGALEEPMRSWPQTSPLSSWPQASSMSSLPQTPLGSRESEPAFHTVPMLEIDGKRYTPWQEAVECRVYSGQRALEELLAGGITIPFSFPAERELEPLRDGGGDVIGVLIRSRAALQGQLALNAHALSPGVYRISAGIVNCTSLDDAQNFSRDQALLHALISCHTILEATEGQLVSLMDPPAALREAAADCRNVGTWPVLAGKEGERHLMLSSPIILYDYPQVAPESAGDFFDATEIDEMLALRILTMTDEEKREMAATDERARALLERTEALTPQALSELHGTMRNLRPEAPSELPPVPPSWADLDALPRLASLKVNGALLKVGDQVELRPRGMADIMDLALAGKLATIEAIERDFEDRVHLAVTVNDDPGRDLGATRMPGHRFFFSPDEVAPVARA